MKSCSKHGRKVCLWCVVTTLSFPIEHAIWSLTPLKALL